MLQDILDQYEGAIATWNNVSLEIAQWLFITLATISLTWAVLMWMLERDDPMSLFIEFTKKILGITFFWMILTYAETWIPTIPNSFVAAGERMSGSAGINATSIVEKGISLASTVIGSAKADGLVDKILSILMSVFIALAIFYVFVRIAIEVTLTLIGSKIILTGGMILLGFLGSPWTRDYGQRYFSAAVTMGIKLMFLLLVISLGENLSSNWINVITSALPEERMRAYLVVLAAGLIYLYIATEIPNQAASLLGGTFFMNSTTAAAGAAAAKGAAMGVMAAQLASEQSVGTAQLTKATSAHLESSSSVASTIGNIYGATSSVAKQRLDDLGSKTALGQIARNLDTRTAAITPLTQPNTPNIKGGGNAV